MARLTLKSGPVANWCESLVRAIALKQGREVAQLLNVYQQISVIDGAEICSTKLVSYVAMSV